MKANKRKRPCLNYSSVWLCFKSRKEELHILILVGRHCLCCLILLRQRWHLQSRHVISRKVLTGCSRAQSKSTENPRSKLLDSKWSPNPNDLLTTRPSRLFYESGSGRSTFPFGKPDPSQPLAELGKASVLKTPLQNHGHYLNSGETVRTCLLCALSVMYTITMVTFDMTEYLSGCTKYFGLSPPLEAIQPYSNLKKQLLKPCLISLFDILVILCDFCASLFRRITWCQRVSVWSGLDTLALLRGSSPSRLWSHRNYPEKWSHMQLHMHI